MSVAAPPPPVPGVITASFSPTLATPRVGAKKDPISDMPALSTAIALQQGQLPLTAGYTDRERVNDDQETTGNHTTTTAQNGSEDPSEESIPERQDGAGEVDNAVADATSDGRLTPIAYSDVGVISGSGSSALSHLGDHNSPGTTISSVSQPSQLAYQTSSSSISVPQAEVGLCSLQTEDQLKQALLGKDRMFMLVVSKEVDSFVSRVKAGDSPTCSATTGPSALAAMASTITLGAQATSKYQRMLVYKAAEWYGLKAVAGPEGSMIIGVVGTLNEKTPSLHLAELVQRPPSPKQNFKLMQRSANGGTGMSRGSSSHDEDGQIDGLSGSKYKTLEQREEAYALARKRIYGKGAEESAISVEGRPDIDAQSPESATLAGGDDLDKIPGHAAVTSSAALQPVYASLYHPPHDQPTTAPIQHPLMSHDPNMAYHVNTGHYPPYGQLPVMTGMDLYSQHGQMPHLYVAQQTGQPPYAQAPYDGMMVPGNYVDTRGHAYVGGQWEQQKYNMPIPMRAPGMMAGQVPMPQQMIPEQGWYSNGVSFIRGPSQPMPMIPQGMPAFAPPYYPQHQAMYPGLVQPTPMRPRPQPHSSASSSMSSRSYQDGSRPHSRGSTTSTRSAASSVRFGSMYPADPRYRQKGIKGPGLNGLTSLGAAESSNRAHSPSSVTTTSSRSSRRAPSINISQPQPGQHQLPTRPDWAKNNVPYYPAPLPTPANHTATGPNTTEFPPLRPGQSANAEPMQVERARTRTNGTVWNGAIGKALQYGSPSQQPALSVSPGPSNSLPGFSKTPVSSTPVRSPPTSETFKDKAGGATNDSDLEFPRRLLSGRAPPTLFDPSVSGAVSRPPSVNHDRIVTSPAPAASEASPGGTGLSTTEAIEAKLAAISVNSGISIGPPAAKSAPSYAKIVRRD